MIKGPWEAVARDSGRRSRRETGESECITFMFLLAALVQRFD